MRNAALEKLVRTDEFGLTTKKELIDRAKNAGWTVKVREMDGYSNGEYSRTKFNRLTGDEQTAYEERMKKRKAVYSIHPTTQGHFYDISKTEFDYFNSLEYVKIGAEVDISTWTAAPGFKAN